MKKSTKCAALLVSLLLLSVGVNSIFILTAGGKVINQAEQVQRKGSTPQQTSAVDCTPNPKHCSYAVR
jgi:hypothetical protein